MWTFAGRQTIRPQSERSHVYSLYGRGDFAKGNAAQRVDGISRRYWRAIAGFFGSVGVRRTLSGHRQSFVSQPGLLRLFPQPIQSHANWFSGRWTNCNRAFAVALAGGICGAHFPDGYPVQFYTRTDPRLFSATLVLALSAQVRRGSPVFRGHAATTDGDEPALFWAYCRVGGRHALDSYPARIIAEAWQAGRNQYAQ